MKRKVAVAGIAVGAILALGPLWGGLGTSFAASLAKTGVSDSQFESLIDVAEFLVTFGIYASPFGLALCAVSIFMLARFYRQPPALPLPPQVPSDAKE
jgi:hypothetical protein